MARFSRGSRGVPAAVVRPAGHRRPPVCRWPGVICPEHGFTLATTEEWTWCVTPDCGRFWLGSHREGGCGEPASVYLADAGDGDRLLCPEHAEQADRQLAGFRPSTRRDQAG
ncbi:hypothetical protein [Amycolatopsis magusensis]|uniref:Uncharacterized protein n=1 Tax=Amycolatopsis magusensis TaxID=882444 RepID=A0ABS4PRT4_9PSEU|nr:hypothetical protein [Amycolatopsis magusensis]MBP2182148.1 hypothetical protein [Amycolatopsis magusensis]MDI5977139.1 hypothetical protein [Amycolatopsis magusensis]